MTGATAPSCPIELSSTIAPCPARPVDTDAVRGPARLGHWIVSDLDAQQVSDVVREQSLRTVTGIRLSAPADLQVAWDRKPCRRRRRVLPGNLKAVACLLAREPLPGDDHLLTRTRPCALSHGDGGQDQRGRLATREPVHT
jgi:hypothetical protein